MPAAEGCFHGVLEVGGAHGLLELGGAGVRWLRIGFDLEKGDVDAEISFFLGDVVK